ncbi:MAG: hypothetical protein MZV70_57725 [Desulfobacterales bacterium]|nr:hypothetical protein [Desulfobacterales bacterium]
MDFDQDIGVPGEFPYLRGNQVTGYRGRSLDIPYVFRHGQRAGLPTQRWHMLLQARARRV